MICYLDCQYKKLDKIKCPFKGCILYTHKELLERQSKIKNNQER